MNNGGGGIFRWLPGTQHEDIFQRHFETPPNRHVQDMAQAMHATYFRAENKDQLEHAIQAAEQTEGNAVVEVVTSSEESASEQERHLNFFRQNLTKSQGDQS